jgi:hypothetical protein
MSEFNLELEKRKWTNNGGNISSTVKPLFDEIERLTLEILILKNEQKEKSHSGSLLSRGPTI